LGCSGAHIPCIWFLLPQLRQIGALASCQLPEGGETDVEARGTDDDVVLDELSTNCLDSIFGDFLYWIKTAADVALLEGLEIALPWRNAPASKLECWAELGTQVWIVVQPLLHDAF
jgi:hypothetical protein